jgi:hypothetical protein
MCTYSIHIPPSLIAWKWQVITFYHNNPKHKEFKMDDP